MHKIRLVWEEDDKFTSKHVEFEMPASSPRRVVQWAVEYTSEALERDVGWGQSYMTESWRTYREVGGKPGEHGVTEAQRRMFSKESDLSVNLDAAQRSSNRRAENVQFDSGKENPQYNE